MIRRSWPQAYMAFLLSRRESLVLKFAPLAILIGSPELVISSFIPVVGEVSDLTAALLTIIVVVKTISAVRKYRESSLTN